MLDLSHKKPKVYKISVDIIKDVYKLTKTFPKEEVFALTSQVKRAAVSITSNIAGGAARKSNAEKRRFYEIARSSLVEVDTQIENSITLGYLNEDNIFYPEKLSNQFSECLVK